MNSPDAIRPAAYWYVVGILIFIVGVVLAVVVISSGVASLKTADAQPVRGNGVVQLNRAGPHSVYIFRAASQRMDNAADRAWAEARSAKVTVRDEKTGADLPVRNVFEEVELQNTFMGRLAEFDVPGPGSYVVQTTPSLEAIKPSVRPATPVAQVRDEILGFVVRMFIGVGIGGLGTVAAIVTLVVTLVLRSKAKKRLAQGIL